MLDVVRAVYDDVKTEIDPVELYVNRPSPSASLPIVWLYPQGYTPGLDRYQIETVLRVDVWAEDLFTAHEILAKIAFLDGLTRSEGDMEFGRFSLQSRSYLPDPDFAGSWQISDIYLVKSGDSAALSRTF